MADALFILCDRLPGQGVEKLPDLRGRDVVAVEETVNGVANLRNIASGERLRDDTFHVHFTSSVSHYYGHAEFTVVEEPLSGLQQDFWVRGSLLGSVQR